MQKFLLFVIAGLMIFLQIGCASKGPLFTEQAIPEKIGMNSYSIKIVDKRENVQDAPPRVPFISFPWQDNKASLKVDEEIENILNMAILSLKSSSDRKLTFETEIIEGYLQFIADAFSETEKVSWKLSIRIYEGANKIMEGHGSCWGERKSIDASPKRLKRMYLNCFEKAVINALLNRKKS